MAYRILPKKPSRYMEDVSTPALFRIQNGATADFAVPCWYMTEPHRCDIPIDSSKLVPIHLTAEGYNRISISFDSAPVGLTSSAWIDKNEDHVVRIQMLARCDSAVSKEQSCTFSINAHTPAIGAVAGRSDVVCSGTLVILPSPYDKGAV